MIDVAKMIKKALIDKGMKQGELADKLGMSKQVFSDFMRRRNDYRINPILSALPTLSDMI